MVARDSCLSFMTLEQQLSNVRHWSSRERAKRCRRGRIRWPLTSPLRIHICLKKLQWNVLSLWCSHRPSWLARTNTSSDLLWTWTPLSPNGTSPKEVTLENNVMYQLFKEPSLENQDKIPFQTMPQLRTKMSGNSCLAMSTIGLLDLQTSMNLKTLRACQSTQRWYRDQI
jgi:hypothetical protein